MNLLHAMKEDPSIKEKLDLSDICDSTSGRVAGLCAEYDAQLNEHQREEKLKRMTKGWSEAQKSRFALLSKAKEDFAMASSAYEGDFAGTLRLAYSANAAESVRKGFLTSLEKFEAGQLPTGTEVGYRDADAELNQIYNQKLADSEDNAEETAKRDEGEDVKKMAADEPEYLRKFERVWLRYRDAWVDFAQIRYPSTNKYAWLILFTKDQTANLRRIQLGG
jgi:uncharacterized protein YecT (DUF1311 family)